MDCDSKEYTQILIKILDSVSARLSVPWGKGIMFLGVKKFVKRTTDGLCNQLKPFLDEEYLDWLQANMELVCAIVDTPWLGRGKHLVDISRINSIIVFTKLVMNKESMVTGPYKY